MSFVSLDQRPPESLQPDRPTALGYRSAQGPVIVVVDDESDMVDLLETCLGTQGYLVMGASRGDEALEIIEEEKPELVILDVAMPGMNGIEVLQRIRSLDAPPAVLMMTAVSDAQVFESLRLGAFGYLLKPFRIEELVTTVQSCLRRAASQGAVS